MIFVSIISEDNSKALIALSRLCCDLRWCALFIWFYFLLILSDYSLQTVALIKYNKMIYNEIIYNKRTYNKITWK